MIWITGIETATKIVHLIIPKSITGYHSPGFDELDMMMAVALKRCYDKQTHFRKIYDHFRSTGSYDEVQGLSNLFSMILKIVILAGNTSMVINEWSTIGQNFGRSVYLKIAEFFLSNPNDYGTIQSRN